MPRRQRIAEGLQLRNRGSRMWLPHYRHAPHALSSSAKSEESTSPSPSKSVAQFGHGPQLARSSAKSAESTSPSPCVPAEFPMNVQLVTVGLLENPLHIPPPAVAEFPWGVAMFCLPRGLRCCGLRAALAMRGPTR